MLILKGRWFLWKFMLLDYDAFDGKIVAFEVLVLAWPVHLD